MIGRAARISMLLAAVAVLGGLLCRARGSALAQEPDRSSLAAAPAPEGLKRLVAAYPGILCGARKNHLRWCDGTLMVYDDGREKSFEQKLASADLEDQMSLPYPRRFSPGVPVNFDPGRIRHEPFFKKMYGGSQKAVRTRLETVIWLPGRADKKIRMTSVNVVCEKLKQVSQEILELDTRTIEKVEKVSGAFVWRTVKDTDRLSVHSFGAAIDVGLPHGDYWKWTRPGPDGIFRFTNRFPLEVVEIFERHGFIWGGKWYHFDTMHFEYRPELLCQ